MNEIFLYTVAAVLPFLTGLFLRGKLLQKQKKRHGKLLQEAFRDIQRIASLESRSVLLQQENDRFRNILTSPANQHMKAS